MSSASQGVAGWPVEGSIFPVTGFDVSVADGPHPLYDLRRSEIDANWAAEHAANPALFNGQMLIHRDMRRDSEGRITGTAHLTPYATMLWWRKQPDRPLAEHVFSVAVPVTAEGAVLAIEMGEATANAGRVYCAAGSLDALDIRNGRVDYEGNMAREVTEETGLDLSAMQPLTDLFGVRVKRALTVFRVFQCPFNAKEACSRVRAHMETDHEKEIAGPVIIRNAQEAHNYAAFMPPIIDWIFGGESPLRRS